jgi:serine/threonine protein kinase
MFSPLTVAQVAFQKGEEIGGEGKNSQTYKAHDPQLNAEIVIKQMLKSKMADAASYFNESRSLYASAHPNVVQVHYACEDTDYVYVAMPFYKNGSVKKLLGQRYLTVREIVRIGCQVLTGLHNVHSKGLIHFDIKSDNVLLSDRQEALISDFGLAKPLNNGFATPDGIYDPNFPPEALLHGEFDFRFDIFQFGLTLYCMSVGLDSYKAQFLKYFDGAQQFDSQRYAKDIAAGTYPDRGAFPSHIPARLKSVCKRCLEVNPANRYSSALEAMNDLAQVEGNLDWQFQEVDGEKTWTKAVEGTIHVFTVCSDLTSILTKSVDGGPARKQRAGCLSNVKPRDIAKVLGTY